MNIIKRSAMLAAAAAATLPFAAGGTAYADHAAPSGSAMQANQDTPLDVDIDLNLDDTDDLRFGVRAITVNSDGGEEGDFNQLGTRAEIGLSNLDELDTDARLVQEDENDGFSVRSILNLNDADDIDSDIDATFLDDNEGSGVNPDGTMTGDAEDGSGDEQTFEDDSDYVFGQS